MASNYTLAAAATMISWDGHCGSSWIINISTRVGNQQLPWH